MPWVNSQQSLTRHSLIRQSHYPSHFVIHWLFYIQITLSNPALIFRPHRHFSGTEMQILTGIQLVDTSLSPRGVMTSLKILSHELHILEMRIQNPTEWCHKDKRPLYNVSVALPHKPTNHKFFLAVQKLKLTVNKCLFDNPALSQSVAFMPERRPD